MHLSEHGRVSSTNLEAVTSTEEVPSYNPARTVVGHLVEAWAQKNSRFAQTDNPFGV